MRSFTSLILAGALAWPAAVTSLPAQQRPAPRPAAPAQRGVGYIRGVLYDSLIGAPLEGARVSVQGRATMSVTDGGGRFRLDSVPAGPQVILFEHEALDSIGLTNLAKRVNVLAGQLNVIELGTPSRTTFWRRLCLEQPSMPSRDSGVVFGSVRDARTGNRLAGATVRVSWIEVERRQEWELARPSVDVRSDSIGNYYACGAPDDIVVTAQVFAGRGRSGVTEVLIGERGIARHDLMVSREVLPFDTTGRTGLATLVGVVRDENDRPRPGARISVDDVPQEVYADTAGRFRLDSLPAGSQMVMARMIGYSAARRMVDLRNGATVSIELEMRSVTVLDTLRIFARSNRANVFLDELEQRLRFRSGQSINQEQIRRRHNTRSLFQEFSGIRVEGRGSFNYRLYSGINCPVTVFIDGIRSPIELLESYRNDQLIAVEYFSRGSTAPLWAQNDQCGVALVWTRFLR